MSSLYDLFVNYAFSYPVSTKTAKLQQLNELYYAYLIQTTSFLNTQDSVLRYNDSLYDVFAIRID